nr:hypothetical protein [Tanacetum cinerariifolium]
MAAAMKHMALNFAKLEKFELVDFRRWQKKIHFLLSSMSMVYVLTTPMPEDGGENPTVEQVRKRAKWDNEDYVCRELWDTLEAKYMAEDASSKKFIISDFTNYKMTDSRPVLEQYNELLGKLRRPSQRFLKDRTKDSGGSVVFERVTEKVVQQPKSELKKSKRHRTPKDFGPEFQLYLIEGTSDEISDQHSYCFNVEDNPKTFDEAMKSQDVAFWKEAINDEIDSLMGNNTWVLTDLPPGIDYFDTYTPNGKNKYHQTVDCYIIYSQSNHSLDGCKDNFIEWGTGIGGLYEPTFGLHHACKIDGSGKGVIICLYVDDMLIFGTDQVQVDQTKEFLSSRFFIKEMRKAYVILGIRIKHESNDVIIGIRIKHESNGISISQSHYIKKVLKKFNYFDCTPVSTPLDTCEKLMPNRGLDVSQLEYSRVIGCLITGKQIQRVLKYLKKTMDYRLVYFGYPSVLKGYTDATWINNTKDNSSTSGWVFLLSGAAGKKAEWLKNLLLEITLWVKPITSISIRCDSAATLAKAYSQVAPNYECEKGGSGYHPLLVFIKIGEKVLKNCAGRLSKPHRPDMSVRRCQNSQSEKKRGKYMLSSNDSSMPSKGVKELNGKRKRDDKKVQSVEHGENLVGERIKVWWPLDKKYYEGFVESFDCSEKKHTVSYDDGDVEHLDLKEQQWELVKKVSSKLIYFCYLF